MNSAYSFQESIPVYLFQSIFSRYRQCNSSVVHFEQYLNLENESKRLKKFEQSEEILKECP